MKASFPTLRVGKEAFTALSPWWGIWGLRTHVRTRSSRHHFDVAEMSRTVLLVGASGEYVRKARELGVEPVVVTGEVAEPAMPGGAGMPAAVVGGSPRHLEVAARIAREAGVPGPDPAAVAACGSLARQRAKFTAAGLRTPAWGVAWSVRAVWEEAKRIGFPLVVRKVDTFGDARAALCADVEAAVSQAGELGGGVLLERHHEGTDYAVQVFGGTVTGIVHLRRRYSPWLIQRGYDVPAELDPFGELALGEIAKRAVAVLGLGFGASSVELRMTGRGPVLLGVRPAPPERQVAELIRLATGIDLVSAQLAAALGDPVRPRPTRDEYACVRFVTVETRSLVRGTRAALAKVAVIPEVVQARFSREEGTLLRPSPDHRDVAGHVVTVSRDARVCRDTADAAVARMNGALTPIGRRDPAGGVRSRAPSTRSWRRVRWTYQW